MSPGDSGIRTGLICRPAEALAAFKNALRLKVVVKGELSEDDQKAFAEGIELDGEKTAPAEITVSPPKDGRQTVHLTIFEGKNREIRRMCEVLGVEVLRLKRERIGNLSLGLLPCGKYRYLGEKDIKKIFAGE